jgi:iron(III) transport system substrate-binding protein
LPFAFQRDQPDSGWREGDPVLAVISPHNEAIRYEFAQAFSTWHDENYGTPAKVDWRVIGGTSEIMRYLAAEYSASFKGWWQNQGRDWPEAGSSTILDHRFKSDVVPEAASNDPKRMKKWELKRDLHQAFRSIDDPSAFTCKIDLFFGGGTYDHGKAAKQGLSVPPWPDGAAPAGTIESAAGDEMMPVELGGETWRTSHFYGTALSTFGICYNIDRLVDLGVTSPPHSWEDLASPVYFKQLGVADPTKSGSIAKAFEMIIHQQCYDAVRAARYTDEQIETFESAINAARLPLGELPPNVPSAYQGAVAQGWLNGLRLVQGIGANARYFTDSASKVPIDVSMGDAAAGLAIDFYGRYQAETSRSPEGKERMVYVTPRNGSSVSADPVSLLRGAEHRELGVRFITFALSDAGQRLWNFRPGTPGGPEKFALRRLPVRRDFYPTGDSGIPSHYAAYEAYNSDPLGDPTVDPYVLGKQFTYRFRWTARHFSFHRKLIRVMCMDSGEELRAAWAAILANGGPDKQRAAMAQMETLPDDPKPISWAAGPGYVTGSDEIEIMRKWTLFFRGSYAKAEAMAEGTL